MEGSTEYTQLLYIPAKGAVGPVEPRQEGGLKLYVKRVFIMDDAEALMPSYLRFVKGVIDSADLPLNVSRELLQESRDVRLIREGGARCRPCWKTWPSTTRHDCRGRRRRRRDRCGGADDKAKGRQVHPVLRRVRRRAQEGLGEDFANRERLPSCCVLPPPTPAVSVGLADYKARMKEGQEAIYYITADTLAAAKNSPQLEVFKKKGIEVLLMTDRVDEWALNYLHDFDGTPLQSRGLGAQWTWASCGTKPRRRPPKRLPSSSSPCSPS